MPVTGTEDEIGFGLHTFGDVGSSSEPSSHGPAIREVIAEGVLAEEVGFDFFGIGEHHRVDYAVSAPDVVIAAVAARTSRVRVGCAVSVLSADDPIRVYQRLSTLQALSSGRAEIILGRGSFAEAFSLFDLRTDQYDALFDSKLAVFLKLLRHPVARRSASGMRYASPGLGATVPPAWIAVGATPASVLRAANADVGMMLAVVGGPAQRFAPFVEIFRQASAKLGRAPRPIGVHSLGYVADHDGRARDEYWPAYKRARDSLGLERGWPPLERRVYDREIDEGSLYVGAPETVAGKIALTARTLGARRFDLKYSVGDLPHALRCRSIELYGRKVMPMVRDILSSQTLKVLAND